MRERQLRTVCTSSNKGLGNRQQAVLTEHQFHLLDSRQHGFRSCLKRATAQLFWIDRKHFRSGAQRLLDPEETIAVLYLVAPLLIFAGSFLRSEIALPACTLILLQLSSVVRITDWSGLKRFWSWRTAYFALFSALWVGISFGIGPIHQLGDWFKHYGVLNFLTSNPWPPTTEVRGIGRAVLRYYVGWYLIPATTLKLTGWAFQQGALFLWSALGILVFFQLVAQILLPRTISAALGYPFVIALFGCPNMLGRLITKNWHWLPEGLTTMPTWWVGWIAYPGNSISLAFVPQHTIAGWLSVALLMRQRDQGPLLTFLMLILCAIALWSPFTAIGILPFFIILAARYGLSPILINWRGLASVLLLGVPIALYLEADVGTLPSGFVTSNPCLPTGACFTWFSYALFLIIEVGAPVLILGLWRKSHQGFLSAAVLALALIPFYKMGLINDFGARACLPALMLLSILCAECIVSGPPRYSVAVFLVLLGVLPDLYYDFTKFPRSVVQTTTTMEAVSGEGVREQYFARLPVWVLTKDTRATDTTHEPAVDGH